MVITVTLLAGLMVAGGAMAGPLEEIKARQEGVRSVKALFRQEKHTMLLERPIKSSGTFYFKSPVGVRWEYKDAMTVVYDGENLYLYYIDLEEVEKVRGASGYVGPLVFDIGMLLKDYDVQAERSPDGIRLLIKPRKPMVFESMEMSFAEGAGFPSRVSVLEESGDRTDITLHDVKINADLPDDLFVFHPPPGVKVRERQLKQE